MQAQLEEKISAQQKEIDELKRVVDLLIERLEQTAQRIHNLEGHHHSKEPKHWSWDW